MRTSRIGLLARAARGTLSVAAVMVATMPAAHAYIDPGTGTMVLQLIGAGVAAVLFYFRNLRMQIMSWFTGRKQANRESAGTGQGADMGGPQSR